MFPLTALVTVCFDLIEAVEIGVVVAAFFALRSVARRSSVTREALPGPAQGRRRTHRLFRLDGALFFGAAERSRADHRLPTDPTPHHVVMIRMSKLGMLDATGANTLSRSSELLEARGMTVIIKGVQPEHMIC